MKSVTVNRVDLILRPDATRVLVRPFFPVTPERAVKVCARVMSLTEEEVQLCLRGVEAEFAERHLQIRAFLRQRFQQIRQHLPPDQKLSEERELLLAAYFTHEYSLEAAALFNPSIVLHPDQSGLAPGSLRFILSLRATGEGHISSVTFRTGLLDEEGHITINDPTRYCLEPVQVPNAAYDKAIFARKLHELGLTGFAHQALQELGETFTLDELRAAIERALGRLPAGRETEEAARETLRLARSNYEVQFVPESRLSERVLFPVSPSESNGIEDARFVAFYDEQGNRTYYATYTAYDGRVILPQLIETPDFLHFKFITLNGSAVQNKGLALFPRKVSGRFAMLARQDYENIYLMFSDHLHFWQHTQLLLKPAAPWEFVQMGNCGSPIETEEGWLVLSHGVGPMRKYCIGAFLLDLEQPSKVLGRLPEPLITPNENEREGYVPNVVYSCGSLLHRRLLVIPYAMSDYAATFATVSLDELIGAIQ